MMNGFLFTIVFLLSLSLLLDLILDHLNLRSFKPEVPEELRDLYPLEKYQLAQKYLGDNIRFSTVRHIMGYTAFMTFLFAGGFEAVNQVADFLGRGLVSRGLFFAGILGALQLLLSLPFSLYKTFVIEARYGFNKTKLSTFILDVIKTSLLGAILGGALFSLVITLFDRFGQNAWIIAWLSVVFFQLILSFVAPAIILPLFNRFNPLPEGGLKTAIEQYLRTQDFRLQGIFTMDGSRRSTKANAFFTGFGCFRRLVLFDTLMQKHSEEELVAVLAHEIGHFKKRHIPISLFLSMIGTGISFAFFSFFVKSEALSQAFGIHQPSIYANLIFIGILYAPVTRFFDLATNKLSRVFEFQADEYAARTYGKPEALISALKNLSRDHLSHLTPHRWVVLFDYSHPPVLDRIRHLRQISKPI